MQGRPRTCSDHGQGLAKLDKNSFSNFREIREEDETFKDFFKRFQKSFEIKPQR
jgi:hypothetical protein